MKKFNKTTLLCPVAADVISDGESIYFYMYDLDLENEHLFVRFACWIKNLATRLAKYHVERNNLYGKSSITKEHAQSNAGVRKMLEQSVIRISLRRGYKKPKRWFQKDDKKIMEK